MNITKLLDQHRTLKGEIEKLDILLAITGGTWVIAQQNVNGGLYIKSKVLDNAVWELRKLKQEEWGKLDASLKKAEMFLEENYKLEN